MLTDTAARNAKTKEKPYKLSDNKRLYLLLIGTASRHGGNAL